MTKRSLLTRFRGAFWVLLFFMAVANAPAQVAPGLPLSTAQIAKRALPATVTVIAVGADGDTLGFGSGFFIRSDGVLVTNYHVLAGASGAIVVLPTREIFQRIRVLNADSAKDIAILRIPSAGLPFLSPQSGIPEVGERVTVVGNPLGLTHTVSEGIVSATRVTRGKELVQISAPISHGSSGGPVVNAQGRAFAIATSYLEGGQQLNFATPLRYALGLLAERIPERSVAEVFAGASSTESFGSEAASAMPTPTSRPRDDVSGCYWVVEKWKDGSKKDVLTWEGVLASSDRVGILAVALFRGMEKLGKTHIYFVDAFRSNSAGQVVLQAGGVSFDGYQTDNGLALIGKMAAGVDSFSAEMIAERRLIPLSQNTGLYSAEVRTFFKTEDRESPNPTDWSGPVAVGFANDTVYVDLFLSNAAGGNTSLTGSAPLRPDHKSFLITSQDGQKALAGEIENGTLIGTWIDRRSPTASFSGQLTAKRQ